MADAALLTGVKQVLAGEWNIAPAAIPDDAALNHFQPWDSLGHIGIVLALAERFAFELNAENVQALTSLPKIVDFLADKAVAVT